MTEHALAEIADEIERLCNEKSAAHQAWLRHGGEHARAVNDAIARVSLFVSDNLPAILTALRRPASPTVAAEDVAAAAIRVADATLCQWGKPNDCGRDGQPCLCEEAAKAVLRRPEPAAGDVEAGHISNENDDCVRWCPACARRRAALPRPEADDGALAALRAVMGVKSVQTLFEEAEEYPEEYPGGEEDVAAELEALRLARAALAAAQEGS